MVQEGRLVGAVILDGRVRLRVLGDARAVVGVPRRRVMAELSTRRAPLPSSSLSFSTSTTLEQFSAVTQLTHREEWTGGPGEMCSCVTLHPSCTDSPRVSATAAARRTKLFKLMLPTDQASATIGPITSGDPRC